MSVCERVKRDIKRPLPVRVRLGLGYGLGYQAFCPVFHFSDILPSSILSSGNLSGIRFGLHRGNPRATTSISIDQYIS